MTFTIQNDPQHGCLRLEGIFTFDGHAAFKAATTEALDAGHPALLLDLSGVGYLDSSALGMLLLLREKAEARGMKVVLCRPSPTVLAILRTVQFGKLFEIQEDGP